MRIVKELALWALLAALVALGAAGIVPISAKAQSQGQAVTIVNGGFDKSGRSTNISGTTSSSSVVLPTTSGETILVMNMSTTNTVYVQLGSSTVAATTAAGIPIFANSSITLARGGNTHIAAITSSSTATVAVLRGAGVPAMAGGGGGSGGSGGAVTIIDGGDVAEGTTTDAACAGDATSGCTLLSRVSRTNARLTTLITNLGTANTNGVKTPDNSSPVVQAGLAYETIAASATAQVLGSSGATGDFLSHCVIYPVSTSPGVVTVFDNANAAGTNVIAFAGGATSTSNLTPISVPVGAFSVAGSWKVTTGTNVIVTCYGKFS